MLEDLTREIEHKGAVINLLKAEIGDAARPLDLFVSEYPSVWVQKLQSGGMRIGQVNWTDEPVTRLIDIRALTGGDWSSIEEFWSGEKIPLTGGKTEIALAAHETKLLVLKNALK